MNIPPGFSVTFTPIASGTGNLNILKFFLNIFLMLFCVCVFLGQYGYSINPNVVPANYYANGYQYNNGYVGTAMPSYVLPNPGFLSSPPPGLFYAAPQCNAGSSTAPNSGAVNHSSNPESSKSESSKTESSKHSTKPKTGMNDKLIIGICNK